jgi:hypothetical protein
MCGECADYLRALIKESTSFYEITSNNPDSIAEVLMHYHRAMQVVDRQHKRICQIARELKEAKGGE